MISKYQLRIVATLLSSSIFCSTTYAANIASLLKDISTNVTIVKAEGSCNANAFLKDSPCLATRATCPTGKIPIDLGQGCTSNETSAQFDVTHPNNYSQISQTANATGYIECNPKSPSYWDESTGEYFPPLVGYSPLCNGKDCTVFNYHVTARCVTSPTKGILDKLGFKY